MRATVAIALCLTACTPAAALEPVAVYDGDTFTQSGIHWRLWGVDALEFDQPHGRDARDNLARLIAGQHVTCTPVGRSYQRVVGRCFAGNVDLSAAQVRAGWALDYARYSHGLYAPAEAEARHARRGMWAGNFTPPWEWRRLSHKSTGHRGD